MKRISKGGRLLLLGAVLVVIDQVVKILVKTHLSYGEGFDVLGHWFRILFIENEGMAFGMAFGGVVGKYILTVSRILLAGVLVFWIRSLIRQGAPTAVLISLTLITAGAIGNVLDCMFYGLLFEPHLPFLQGRVVDMLYFPIIDTYVFGRHFTFFDPVFNIADSCVTIGVFWFIIHGLLHNSNTKS